MLYLNPVAPAACNVTSNMASTISGPDVVLYTGIARVANTDANAASALSSESALTVS